MRSLALTLAAALLVSIYACSSDDDHTHGTNTFPACEEISEACHDLDTGSGVPHECHELAHEAKDEATCTAKKAECLAGCVKADGGASDAATGG